MRRKIFYLILSLLLPLMVCAENASNARAQQRSKDIIITYDLSRESDVQVYISYGDDDSYRRLLKAVEGAVGKHVSAGKSLEIVWHPLDEEDSFIANNVRFKVVALTAYEWYTLPKSHQDIYLCGKTNMETFILGDLAYSVAPQMSYGLTFGQTYCGVGWFVDARSNFCFIGTSGVPACDDRGCIDSVYPFYSGKTYSSIFSFHAGLIVDFIDIAGVSLNNRFNTFGLYVGVGYGSRQLFWEMSDGQLVIYKPNTYQGINTNLGFMGSFYGFTVKAGMNTISFQYLEFEAGVGWMF